MKQTPENRDRAKRLLRVLINQYGKPEAKCDIESMIADTLADLRHLCDKKKIDFSELDRVAYGHYVGEIHGVL